MNVPHLFKGIEEWALNQPKYKDIISGTWATFMALSIWNILISSNQMFSSVYDIAIDHTALECTQFDKWLRPFPSDTKNLWLLFMYESVSKSFQTSRLERELQMVQISATKCSCTAILWVWVVSLATITLCVASQQVFIVVSVNFVTDSYRKLLDTPSFCSLWTAITENSPPPHLSFSVKYSTPLAQSVHWPT
jgi:hypothetical protein